VAQNKLKKQDRPRWRHDGVTAGPVDDYLYSMLPKGDEVLREMEDFASLHNVPIVGPAVARVLEPVSYTHLDVYKRQVFEIVDNSIDEHMGRDKNGKPFCDNVKVTIHLDGSCSIEDDGRGIPVDMHPKYKMPSIELVLTNLHAGGKFGKGAYVVSGGLHGVGAKLSLIHI